MKYLKIKLFATCVILTCSQVNAAPLEQVPVNKSQKIELNSVYDFKRDLAKKLSKEYSHFENSLKSQVNEYNMIVSIDKNLESSSNSQLNFSQVNSQLRQIKGLTANGEPLLQVRLAHRDMLLSWQQGNAPLFAFEPKGNEKNWRNIEAFDIEGNTHLLDVYTLPEQPVFVVELNSHKSIKAGLQVMKAILSSTDNKKPLRFDKHDTNSTNSTDISTSVLKKIKLSDDKEPWVSGKADIYAIVTGVDSSRDKAMLDVVDLPYLDHDKTDYSPNQILIHWERYRWQAANIILMEQDDNTNYKVLGSKLLNIAEQILKSIPEPEAQGIALLTNLTDGLIQAMPDNWFTNEDDYVDVFYTLFENESYNNYYGASNNAVITLEPIRIQPR
jgi:hypothetical protein